MLSRKLVPIGANILVVLAFFQIFIPMIISAQAINKLAVDASSLEVITTKGGAGQDLVGENKNYKDLFR